MSGAHPIAPGPGQESVWEYPRPPRIEPTDEHVQVVLGGRVICDTRSAVRVLETSHPPTYYLPIADFVDGALEPCAGSSFCEFKGRAAYYDIVGGDRRVAAGAWGYPEPSPSFEGLRDHVALYAGRVDECRVQGELVTPQPGDFYGGWITSRVVGPFKGVPGSMGW